MIKLNPASIRVRGADGQEEWLNLDSISEELRRCAREAGVAEPMLVPSVMNIVRAYIDRRGEDPVSAAELDGLMVRMLWDSGYPGVARALQQRRDALPLSPGAKLLEAPGKARIATLLATDAFFISAATDDLATACVRALETLGLRRVTETLLLELAKSLWLKQRLSPQVREDDATPRCWAIGREGMVALARDLDAELAAISRVHPVSVLLPKVRLELSLPLALGARARGLELAVLPRFASTCARVRELLAGLRAGVKARINLGAAEFVPVRVVFRDLAALALDNGDTGAWEAELQAIAEACFADLEHCRWRFEDR